jgi:hypothetical protein
MSFNDSKLVGNSFIFQGNEKLLDDREVVKGKQAATSRKFDDIGRMCRYSFVRTNIRPNRMNMCRFYSPWMLMEFFFTGCWTCQENPAPPVIVIHKHPF